MSRSKGSTKELWTGFRPYGITAAAIAAAYVLYEWLNIGEPLVRALMLFGLAVCGFVLRRAS